MTKKQNYIKPVYLLLILFLLVVTLISGQSMLSAFADSPSFTGALEDLRKDESFSESNYPYVADDCSLQVIEIAEGSKNELFIYVFQPSFTTLKKPLIATCLNMSLTSDISDTALYNLTFCNSDGAFQKYAVDGVTVSDAEERYYIITSIYRPWDELLDDPPEGDNTISEVAFKVGKFYTVTTNTDGTRKYSFQEQDVVTITEKYVGFLQYSDGFKWMQAKHCRSHYVAFSTDRQIDELYEAEISYEGVRHNIITAQGKVTEYDFPAGNTKIINYKDTGENDADWFLGRKYSWQRIEKAGDFIADPINDLKPEVREQIENKQWVFRFLETTVESAGAAPVSHTTSYTIISDVTILRLKFLSGVKVYNLGVVDNKQTGGNTPGNNNTDEYATLLEWLARVIGIPEWLVIVLIVIIALLVVALVFFVLSFFFPIFGIILRFAGKALAWLITAPFKGIAALVRKIKDKKDGGS